MPNGRQTQKVSRPRGIGYADLGSKFLSGAAGRPVLIKPGKKNLKEPAGKKHDLFADVRRASARLKGEVVVFSDGDEGDSPGLIGRKTFWLLFGLKK